MGIISDTINDILDRMELTEERALELAFKMARKFDWSIVIWTMDDVRAEDEDGYETTDGLTDPMKNVVSDTWAWRQGINDAVTQYAAEIIPHVTVHPDGTFTVDGRRHTAAGGPVPGGK